MQAFRRLFNVLKPPAKNAPKRALQRPTALVPRLSQTPAMYEQRNRPWWIKWMYGLVAANIVMTASSLELALNHWSHRTTEKRAYATDDDDETEDRYILRSARQRYSVASLIFIAGCTSTVVALYMRAQYVIAMDILPKSGTIPRSLFVQTIRTGPKVGYRVPMDTVELLPGKRVEELVVKVESRRSPWYISLDNNAIIHGRQQLSPLKARLAVAETWGPSSLAPKLKKQIRSERFKAARQEANTRLVE